MKKINLNNIIRNHILQMQAYSAARLEFDGSNAIFIDANENPFGSVSDYSCNRYPDPLQTDIKNALAILEDISPKQIFIGNGSDECIDLLIRAYCEPKQDAILYFPPVFSMYQHCADVHHIHKQEILLLEGSYQLDIDKILNRISNDDSIKIIFICNPNNPTGNLIHTDDILSILDAFNGLVVIDEAYIDFSDATSFVSHLHQFNNLVVLKTFSKSWGMASIRLGYLMADEQIIQALNTIKMPYNIGQHTQETVLNALQHHQTKTDYINEIIEQKNILLEALKQFSFIEKIYPTAANYVLIKVDDANKLYQHLIKDNIVVRNRSKLPLCENSLRITFGTANENQQLLTSLKNYQ
ncbi:MAG: histidinol-phosphate transaminase [Chitinophagales bacterium]|nr:histidinol-phosphate transaminase [Chitinophagales bacterium]